VIGKDLIRPRRPSTGPLHTASERTLVPVNRFVAEAPLVPYRESISREQLELPLSQSIVRESKAASRTRGAPDDTGYQERQTLFEKYADKLAINTELSRALVSFQANKTQPVFRWFKYKEAFSTEFVHWILTKFHPRTARAPIVLDPFAGGGTTLHTAAKRGWQSIGIELLSPAVAAIRARTLAEQIDVDRFNRAVNHVAKIDWHRACEAHFYLSHLRITQGAYAPETETALANYSSYVARIRDPNTRELMRFAAMCVLEEVSYTRKDGQYLRWDSRSPRDLRSRFNKGVISDFPTAIARQLQMMTADLARREVVQIVPPLLEQGSLLQKLPALHARSVDLILTSPPYCNRYDYSRTYALELAYLGCTEEEISRLRQTLLSATVENKNKRNILRDMYAGLNRSNDFAQAERVFDAQAALHEALGHLNCARDRDELNNANIPKMIANYFFEMNIVVREFARVLRKGGRVVMVNDNVQYHGEEIPVDLILSEFADTAGLDTESIWVLGRGKGNSSQQMGVHGRNELRKCVYVWSKR
jgi:hypothetical protein